MSGPAEDVDRLLADLQRRLTAGPTAADAPAPTSTVLTTPIVFIEPE
ncbi:MAG TPA: hypothetical protein VFT95_00505 [Micromonosporaceae bacterium]|nr:hypothetical protein [Micromonosporaceae bacterium]